MALRKNQPRLRLRRSLAATVDGVTMAVAVNAAKVSGAMGLAAIRAGNSIRLVDSLHRVTCTGSPATKDAAPGRSRMLMGTLRPRAS
jgi:hypothetical protein